MAFKRCRTHLHAPLGLLAAPPRADGLSTRLTRAEISCWCHMTSPNDVISPRQQPRKHIHVSPSPRQRHVIGWRHRIYCTARDPSRKPGTDPDQYPLTLTWTSWLWLWLWLFALTFDQKSKFPTGPILLSFSRRFQFWTPFLHLKLQNWSIGTFFIVVSSKALFMAFSRDLLMLIQPQAFIELPPWVWGRVLEIYIRHISPM